MEMENSRRISRNFVALSCRLMSRYLLPDLYRYVFPPLFRSLAAINSLEIKSVIFAMGLLFPCKYEEVNPFATEETRYLDSTIAWKRCYGFKCTWNIYVREFGIKKLSIYLDLLILMRAFSVKKIFFIRSNINSYFTTI